MNVPLPCDSSIRNWTSKFLVKPGILDSVLNIMDTKGQKLSVAEKLTVLTFDEVYISNKIDIERREQKVYGPHKTCQVVMARGLFGSWKQPVYYDFSKPMTKDVLFEIIEALHKRGYIVVAVANDMGSTNMGLWKDLDVGVETSTTDKRQIKIKNFFVNPADKALKIFVFADVPHLIKLLRNNLLDAGFLFDDCILSKSLLEELLALNAGDLKAAFNLTRDHLDVKGFQRQKVKLAAQVFSRRNAKAMRSCGEQGFLKSKYWEAMADMLELANNWFDVLNTQSKFGCHEGLRAYGLRLDEQNDTLDRMTEFASTMRVCGKKNLMPFQKGILLVNKSLKDLFMYVKETYTCKDFVPQYIITRRLCQDLLENFFAQIRAMGGMHGNPSPVEFQNRLKWYILGKHSEYGISDTRNTEADVTSSPILDLQDVCDFSESETLESFLQNEDPMELTFGEGLLMEGNGQDTPWAESENGEDGGNYCI